MALAKERELIAVDLPGFGETPPPTGEVSIATLADELTTFIADNDLGEIDLVGSSMGARLVLELARRGVGGAVVALDPGGFWTPGQLRFFSISLRASIALVRALQPVLPALTGNPVGRTALLVQFSARPWALPGGVALRELRGFTASPSFDAALDSLVHGPLQEGMPVGSARHRIVIGWGRQDRVCFPSQAKQAQAKFPEAELHWFKRSGHFPHWDEPAEVVEVILLNTG